MPQFYEEPLADVSKGESPVYSTVDSKDDPKDDSKDDSKDSFIEDTKTATKGIDALQKGFTLLTSAKKEENAKKKQEAINALVDEVPKLEAKIDEQTAFVENLKEQSVALYAAIKHNYDLITDIQSSVEQQNNAIENQFINVETKLNVVLSRIDRAKQAIIQHIGDVEAEVINKHRNKPKLKVINHLNHAFDAIIVKANEFKKFTIVEKVSNFDTNEGEPNALDEWEQTRIPQFEDGVYNSLWDIINEDWAIPKDPDDQVSLITLNILCYGMYFYGYILHYLMEQYSQLLEYYRLNTDLDSYNRCYWKKLNTLNDFASTLVGSNGFFARVEEVLARVKNLDYIQIYRKDVLLLADANIENLAVYRGVLRKLRNTFISAPPEMLDPDLDFSTSNTTTIENNNCHATDFWTKGSKVSYAIQLLSYNMTTSSLVSKWSPGYTLEDKANPIVKVYPDILNRTKVIFRRFEGEFKSKPKIVAILQDPKQLEFRDIDRDLYDFASEPNPAISLPKVKFYIEHGANVNAILEKNQVALHGAAQHRGLWEVASELIKNGADIDVQDIEGYTPLSIATERGNHEIVTKLLDHKANVTLATSEKHHRLTPLHIAVYKGHTSIVRDLIKANGIDMNARSIEGFTALHFAVAFDYEDIVSLLLEDKRTEIDPKSYFRVSVPAYIKLIKKLDRIAAILATSAKVTPLHLAYAIGNEKLVTLLLANGADINARTSDGSTVMHFAAFYDNVELIPDCSKNAIFNSPNLYYITPLMVAFQHNNTAVADKFLKQCTDINVRLFNYNTMLHVAVQSKEVNIVKQLIDNGLSVSVRDYNGRNPLEYAIWLGDLPIVEALLNNIKIEAILSNLFVYSIIPNLNKIEAYNMLALLIKHGLDVNIQDINKNTLLHYAIAFGYESSVDLLLRQRSINLDAQNEKNETPLHLALKLGNVRIANALFNKGASVTIKGSNNWTAVNYAIANGKINSAQTVKFVEKFLPKTKECEKTDEARTVLYGLNIPQASEYDKFEVVKFYGEQCEELKMYLDKKIIYRPSDAIAADFIHKVCSTSNAEVIKYLFPDDIRFIDLIRNCHDKEMFVYDSLRGHVNFETLQFFKTRDLYIIADNECSGKNPNWMALNYTIMGNGDRKIVQFLAEGCNDCTPTRPLKLPSIHNPEDKNENLMHLAAKANKSDIAEFLFANGVTDVNAVNKDGYMPLHIASRNGDIKMVRFLIENGANKYINNKTSAGTTPLTEAVWNDGNLDVVKYLVGDCNAKIEPTDGWTLMNKAAQLDKTYVAIYLCEQMKNDYDCSIANSDGISPMHFAAANNNINLAEYFFSKNIYEDVYDKLFITPIYYAIRDHGQLQMVKYLHSKEVQIKNFNCTHAENIISLAITKGKYDIAKFLINHDADVQNTCNSRSKITPLHEAVKVDQTDIIQMLIQKGADYTIKDASGRSPVDDSIVFQRNALKYFILNFKDKDQLNRTLQHQASIGKQGYEILHYLVESGSDFNSLDKNKNTPLHLVVLLGDFDFLVRELLKSTCIDISIKNENGKTALNLAEDNNYTDIIEILKNHHQSRKRRQIATEKSISTSFVTSSAPAKPTGFVNCVIDSLVSVLKSVPARLSSLMSFTLGNFNAHSSAQQSASISLHSTDLNSSLLLLDVFIRKQTGQRYVDTTVAHSATPLEARVFALALVEKLKMRLDQLTEQSGQEQIELDWFTLYGTVERLMMSAQYDEIERLMHSTARNAFPCEIIDKRLLVELVDQVLNKLSTEQAGETSQAGMHSFSGDNCAQSRPQVASQLDGINKQYLN